MSKSKQGKKCGNKTDDAVHTALKNDSAVTIYFYRCTLMIFKLIDYI